MMFVFVSTTPIQHPFSFHSSYGRQYLIYVSIKNCSFVHVEKCELCGGCVIRYWVDYVILNCLLHLCNGKTDVPDICCFRMSCVWNWANQRTWINVPSEINEMLFRWSTTTCYSVWPWETPDSNVTVRFFLLGQSAEKHEIWYRIMRAHRQ